MNGGFAPGCRIVNDQGQFRAAAQRLEVHGGGGHAIEGRQIRERRRPTCQTCRLMSVGDAGPAHRWHDGG